MSVITWHDLDVGRKLTALRHDHRRSGSRHVSSGGGGLSLVLLSRTWRHVHVLVAAVSLGIGCAILVLLLCGNAVAGFVR
jgi:hypothetical protein